MLEPVTNITDIRTKIDKDHIRKALTAYDCMSIEIDTESQDPVKGTNFDKYA